MANSAALSYSPRQVGLVRRLRILHQQLWTRLERLVANNNALEQADASDSIAPVKLLRKLPFWIGNGAEMAKLFLMPAIDSERFQPAVR